MLIFFCAINPEIAATNPTLSLHWIRMIMISKVGFDEIKSMSPFLLKEKCTTYLSVIFIRIVQTSFDSPSQSHYQFNILVTQPAATVGRKIKDQDIILCGRYFIQLIQFFY